MGVADAQIELRGGVTLLCGLAVPPRGEAVARLDAASLPVAHAQIELGRRVTALGGLAVPAGGFTVVRGTPFPAAYRTPISNCAAGCPWSAARRNHDAASA